MYKIAQYTNQKISRKTGYRCTVEWIEELTYGHRKSIKRICGTLRDFVPFVQFKKREKHPWRTVNFSKVTG